MPALTKEETKSFHDLYKKSYLYLLSNFEKFNERNKIQVAIAVCKMAVPQTMKMEHTGSVAVQMAAIQKEYESADGGSPLNRISEFDIGSLDATETS